MYTRGGKSTVEKPTLVNKPKIYKGRLGEVREARGGKSTKPLENWKNVNCIHLCEYDVFCTLNNCILRYYVPIYEFYRHLWPKRWTTRIHSLLPLVCWRLRDVENLIRLPSTEVWLLELILYVIWILTSNPSSIYYYTSYF